MRSADAGELIARQGDVRALVDALAEPGVVVVVGPPGLGKTSVARAVSRTLEAAGHAITWCEPGAHADALALMTEIARALGVALPTGASVELATSIAARALADRFLILDDVDLRVRLVAEAIDGLARATQRGLLVTARASGNVGRVHRLRPLSLSTTAAGVLDSECGRAWQAHARRRGLTPSAHPIDPHLLFQVLGELDGLPLAIELAAARSGVLSLTELLRALRRDRFEVLRGEGEATAGLERAIAASWATLASAERSVLESCALFPSGFSVPLLARVSAEPRLLDVLARLVDQSLVARRVDDAERAWLVLPSSVQAFARREIDRRGDHAELEARVRRAYAEELEQLTARPSDSLRVNALLEHERDNLLALTSTVSSEDAGDTLRMFATLGAFYWAEGLSDAQLAALSSALDRAHAARPLVRARALTLRGRVRRRRGDERSEGDLREAIEIAATAGEGEAAALAGRELGWWLIAGGRFDDADAVLTAAGAHALGAPYAEAWVQLVRSQLDRHHGRIDLGRARAHAAMMAFRRLAASFDETLALLEASEQCLMAGEHARARTMSEAGFALANEMGASGASLAANFLVMLAAALVEASDVAAAMRAVADARARATAMGDTVMETAASAVEVLAHWSEGDVSAARTVVGRVIPDLELRGDRIWGGFFIALEGAMAAEQGHEVDAEVALARATKDFPVSSAYLAAIHLCSGHLELLRARRAAARGATKEARHHLNVAVALAASARAPGPPSVTEPLGSAPACTRLSETRVVLRVLDAAIARQTTPPRARLETRGLRLERGAEWLSTGTRRVSLAKRPVLRGLVLELARERVAHPGVALSSDRLIAAGWPGERMIHASAVSRLRMAISRLRAAGLASMLRTEGDGYYLDEAVQVSFIDE